MNSSCTVNSPSRLDGNEWEPPGSLARSVLQSVPSLERGMYTGTLIHDLLITAERVLNSARVPGRDFDLPIHRKL